MNQRKDYQRVERADGSAYYRSQMVHPVTGRKINLRAESLDELRRQKDRVRTARADLRLGADPDTTARQLRPVRGRALSVAALWERYFPGVPERSRAIARAAYERRIEPFLGQLSAWDLDETRMRRWVQELASAGYAPKTIDNAYHYLRAALRLALDSGDMLRYPWGRWRPDPPPDPEIECLRTIDELAALYLAARATDEIAWARGTFSDLSTRVLVLALTGLRQREASALGWDHLELDGDRPLMLVEFQAGRGWWRRSDRPRDPVKTKKPRTLLLHPSVVEVLRGQRAQLERFGWHRPDGPLFPGRGGRWRRGIVLKPERLRQLVRSAGLPRPERWRTHSLRHSFATLELIAWGGDLKATAARTGHADIRILQRYLHRTGRGLPESRVPVMPVHVGMALPASGVETRALEPTPDVPAVEVITPGDALSDLARATTERAGEWQRMQDDARARRRSERAAQGARPWVELAREWLESGREPAPRPRAVTSVIRKNYTRAYARARSRGEPKEKAARAGTAAQRAALGAWGKALKQAERERAARTSDDAAE